MHLKQYLGLLLSLNTHGEKLMWSPTDGVTFNMPANFIFLKDEDKKHEHDYEPVQMYN